MNVRTPLAVLLISFMFISCVNNGDKEEVVIYTSVDQVFSSKILKKFEEESGIVVRAVYDTEASKAVGLEKRLFQERKRPRADVFWNSENLRTARLDSHDLFLEQSKNNVVASWFGMGIRSRVFIVNTDLMNEASYPSRLEDLTNSKYRGEIAISNPLFGTASAQFAALLSKWGEERFIIFLKALKANGVAILAGNSTVKSAVGRGEYTFGMVDTDDALVGIEQGLPLKTLYYNQKGDGVYSLYQTVAIVKNGPNPKTAQKLFDFLLSSSMEEELIDMNAVQFSLLSDKTKSIEPVIWSPSPEKTAMFLKQSAELIREYLD